jgi:hypothetical protein
MERAGYTCVLTSVAYRDRVSAPGVLPCHRSQLLRRDSQSHCPCDRLPGPDALWACERAEMIVIDGSEGEGGGQILRSSLSLLRISLARVDAVTTRA